MATLFSQLNKTFDRMQKAQVTASYRSANKAMAKAKTHFQRLVVQESGLSSKKVSPRFQTRKASSKSLASFISFGVKFGVSLSEFKPKVKVVKIGKGKTAKRFNGVTVKLPSEGRVLVAKAFLWQNKSGKSLVLQRKTQAKYPLANPKYSLQTIAKNNQANASTFLRNEYKKIYSEQIKYEISKLKS